VRGKKVNICMIRGERVKMNEKCIRITWEKGKWK
jgi:hypothetical protein